MTHFSEDGKSLSINQVTITEQENISQHIAGFNDVCLIVLPIRSQSDSFYSVLKESIELLGKNATLITIGSSNQLVHVQSNVPLVYQLWISIKRKTPQYSVEKRSLPNYHFGALVHTAYQGALKHTVTRIKYTYCPACDRTTKDYGGKKHTYNSYGTLISDIWRDIACDLEADLSDVIERFSDLFGLEGYQELRVLDCRNLKNSTFYATENQSVLYKSQLSLFSETACSEDAISQLINGDCLEQLKQLPSNSVDFAFIDPPYNLGKNYNGYSDDLSIQEYFLWCDIWIKEVARVLRPGRTLAILNIPLWAIRHFLFLEKILEFQNWIAWDALSFPVRKIMPAHYAILCFSKGKSRSLPGLVNQKNSLDTPSSSRTFLPLAPLAQNYCLRAECVRKRNALELTDRGMLTDLWWDIHRLKHNSRRVDHLCQLPPQLLYRLICIFTNRNEVVLDCFNGVGTTSLTAHQLGRQYIGIEISEKYHQIAEARHEEIRQGLDPFRKEERKLTEKNSRVPRKIKQVYEISKKELQLEVKRVANQLGRMPSREDVINYGKYSIRYYDEYFSSWGEASAAARHDGMSESRANSQDDNLKNAANNNRQLGLFS
ncbi:site-specific DNA-methyltransferase [Microcoleus sp. FACHB-1515]|uniref:DNA methyltransferase n=1 Tax=Cyanophyceae TaxID=3028117 RepID=UPI0016891265|nr:DNA methyltransferase [Microcoleus sp. FACHB-1515]MBD2090475.1 site-specific DNA-methyltransferase [Microcoleus sp. FACHB-1515]